MKKRRLGKGLESLIGGQEDAGDSAEGAGVRTLPLARIELNPYQPRKQIDEDGLEELTESIRSAGILQPVVVRPAGGEEGGYELIMGERRLRAARRAGLESVPALVREVDDRRMLELALIENVQRRDLGAIEKAVALRRMCEELDITQQDVAERIGLKRPTVANLIRLLDLPEEVQDMVSRGTISAGHARALLSAPPRAIPALAERISAEGLSVRDAERLAAAAGAEQDDTPARKRNQPPPHVRRMQAILSESLGAEVSIKTKGKKGSILIHFSSQEEFERLFAAFTGGEGRE